MPGDMQFFESFRGKFLKIPSKAAWNLNPIKKGAKKGLFLRLFRGCHSKTVDKMAFPRRAGPGIQYQTCFQNNQL
jgi:hypothetical protein